MVFCPRRQYFPAGIHTATEPEHCGHCPGQKEGPEGSLLYKQFTHQQIKKEAVTLYVEGANGKPMDASAELYEKNNASLRQAFACSWISKVQSFMAQALTRPGVLVPINHLQGKFYRRRWAKSGKRSRNSDRPFHWASVHLVAPISLRIRRHRYGLQRSQEEVFRLPLNPSRSIDQHLDEPLERRS